MEVSPVSSTITYAMWLASACRTGAVLAGVPVVRLRADGAARVRRQTTSVLSTEAAQLGRVAAVARGYASVAEGTPAVPAMRTQPTKHIANFASFAKGGMRGPHPWRDPVKT